MRLIILVLGMVFLECFSKHWGIELGSKTDSESVFKILFWYALFLDLIKK